MSDNAEIFKEFGKKIPKGSYVIIIRDQPNGATDFMCYDSTDKKEVTDGYTVMRGITATILNEPEYLLERGQLAIYRDTKITKPDVEQPFILEQDKAMTAARIQLVKATSLVICTGLNVLSIKALEKM